MKGYSESGTTSITGIRINTVSKYFKKWHNEILEHDNREFSYGFEDYRTRMRLSIDFELKELYKIQKDMNQEFDEHKSENNGKIPHGKGLYKERMKIAELICDVISGSGIVFTARTDEETQAEVEEELRERKQKRYNESLKPQKNKIKNPSMLL